MESDVSRAVSVAIALAGLLGLTTQAAAQRSFADFSGLAGLERTTLSSPQGDRLDIIRYSGSEPLPAVVVIPGSLCAPVFAALDNAPGEAFATVPLLSPTERETLDSHLIYLERRNIVSLETLSAAPEFSIEQIFKLSPCTDRNGALTLEQRVADSLTQVRWLRQQK